MVDHTETAFTGQASTGMSTDVQFQAKELLVDDLRSVVMGVRFYLSIFKTFIIQICACTLPSQHRQWTV